MRARYPDAIRWLAWNDDCSWTESDDAIPTNAAWLVSEVFGKTVAKVRKDVVAKRAADGLAAKPKLGIVGYRAPEIVELGDA